MIHLAREDCRIEHRNGIIAIRGLGKNICPLCGRALGVRGTCRRKVYTMRGAYILQLRVLYCCECGRTHRELPYFLIPYKRYSVNAIYDTRAGEGRRMSIDAGFLEARASLPLLRCWSWSASVQPWRRFIWFKSAC